MDVDNLIHMARTQQLAVIHVLHQLSTANNLKNEQFFLTFDLITENHKLSIYWLFTLARTQQLAVIHVKVTTGKNDGADKNTNYGATTKNEAFSWNDQMDAAFIEAMLKEQNAGNRPNGTFSPHAYNNMVKALSDKFEEIDHLCENNVVNYYLK
ncbi:myb/SANT-like domain-containing protein [Artemisia annua]|uniref:Myb/SANT-like domain-containing protein n=1 Tax=Artemisia annua TaxID=35608 RepID=A0A2U1PL15_ARTAN|nr:myb/SANT-like domain-containing protein [Artemisia annua]